MPHFQPSSLSVGPLTVQAFGMVVAAAVVSGLKIGAWRFRRLGFERATGERLAWSTVVGGLLGAR